MDDRTEPDFVAAKEFYDRFESNLAPDRTKSYTPVHDKIGQSLLETLYASSDIAERIVDLVVDEAMRERLQFSDEDEAKQTFLDQFDIWKKIARAWKDARLCGGSALFLNVADGKDLSEPFELDSAYEFSGVVQVSCSKLKAVVESVVDDITDADFGLPSLYRLQSTAEQLIHRSRLIIFDGSTLPEEKYRANGYWHQSVLSKIHNVIKDFDIIHTNISELVRDANYFVFKIPHLKNLLSKTTDAQQYGDYISTRIRNFTQNRDRSGALMIDADESVEVLNSALQGLADLMDRSKRRLQMAVRIPAPILFNESPGSAMSTNGSSEQSFWYDHLHSQRSDYLKPRLQKIIDTIANSSNRDPQTDDWSFDFKPLFQLSESEQWDIETKSAAAVTSLIQSEVLQPDEARSYYKESKRWSRYMTEPQD